MSSESPTLRDIWRLLGTMNKRFDALEREVVQIRGEVGQIRGDVAGLKAHVTASVGALKESIEARDFRNGA